MDRWMHQGLLLSSLTSTFWQAKSSSVPTRSRNRTAASGKECECPELYWDLPPLSLQPPRAPKALQGSQAKDRVTREQVMEVLGTRSSWEWGQERFVTIPSGQGLREYIKIKIEGGELGGCWGTGLEGANDSSGCTGDAPAATKGTSRDKAQTKVFTP